jgi:hypothetical protein
MELHILARRASERVRAVTEDVQHHDSDQLARYSHKPATPPLHQVSVLKKSVYQLST